MVNGWSNYETWLVNLWYGDWFNDMVEEGQTFDAETIRDYVEDMLANDGALPPGAGGFAADILTSALNNVNWEELADHYNMDIYPEGIANDE